ncbi:sialate O-acetylesterase [Haloferula helveola]
MLLLALTVRGLADEPERHLFILSGQSNMTGGLAKGFTETVGKEFGAGNIEVAMSMKSGRGIRFWVADYEAPEGSRLAGKKSADNGSEYPKLLNAAEKTGDARSFASVTFVWMQGESDGGNGMSAAYAESFRKLRKRLMADLGLKRMNTVIGRISDFGLHGDKADGWREVRDAQVKLAEELENGAWIDTDDLNDAEGKPEGHLHYPKEQSIALGNRFANRAIGLIRDRR